MLAVPQEKFGLENVLREALEDDSRLLDFGEVLDQIEADSLVVALLHSLILHVLLEVDVAHVGSRGKVLGNVSLSRGLGSGNEHGLGQDSSLGLGIYLTNVSPGIDLSDLSELGVILNNGVGLVEVVLDSLLDGLGVVVGSAACLSSLQTPLEHHFLRNVVEQYLLGLQAVLLEVLSLVNSSGESVN